MYAAIEMIDAHAAISVSANQITPTPRTAP
jgi:hypothetical protein